MYNTKVERHSFGISKLTEHTRVSESVAANEFLQKRALLEHYSAIDRKMENSEKEFETSQAIGNVARHKLLESQIPVLINQIYQTGREVILKDILFEMFSKSLVLDEEFIVEQEENLRALVESYVEGKGGYSLLENAYRETKSPFLKSIKTVCESTANKVARRKMNDAQENQLDVSAIKFELNDDEKQELDYEKEKISVDKLSELVKNKVLTVVQDEKARQAKEEEVYQDLEDQAQENGGDDESVAESVKRSIIREMPVEESTLFNSLFRHSYKEMLESVASSVSADSIDDDDDNPDDYNINATEKDVMASAAEFQEDSTLKGESAKHGSVQSDIDMDLILAESITKYTLMELSYTIQLENYGYDSIRKISQQLLN
jgi:hypothetical protein